MTPRIARLLAMAGALCAAAAPASAQQEAAGPDRAATVEFTWTDRPTLTFGDHVKLQFRGRFQTDVSRSEAAARSASDLGDIEKRRIGIEGRIGKSLDFEVSRELSDSRPWRDAFVDYRRFDAVRLQAGRFKLPVSLDENTGGASLAFVNRSMLASALAPGRDQGVMLHGRLWGRALSYEAGVFAHDGDNARARDDASRPAGRTTAVRISTVVGGRSGLHAAVAVASSEVPATIWTLRGRTALEDTFFPSTLWVQGSRRRVGLEARWARGPFAMQSEYIRLTQERLDQGAMSDLAPVTASGWYVSGTWAVAGVRASRTRSSQARSVLQRGRGVELAVRLEALTFGQLKVAGAATSPRADVIAGNRDQALTLGANWYLGSHLKLQGNVIRDALSDPSRGPLPLQPAWWSSVVRLQVGL